VKNRSPFYTYVVEFARMSVMLQIRLLDELLILGVFEAIFARVFQRSFGT
jgi:hypothetical protein